MTHPSIIDQSLKKNNVRSEEEGVVEGIEKWLNIVVVESNEEYGKEKSEQEI